MLLTEHHLEFLSLKGAAEARPSLHMSKYHFVGNHMHWLIFMLGLKVRFGYTKFMLIYIKQCLAETLHVISF